MGEETLKASHMPFSLNVEETEAQRRKESRSRCYRLGGGGDTGTQSSPHGIQSFLTMSFYVAALAETA